MALRCSRLLQIIQVIPDRCRLLQFAADCFGSFRIVPERPIFLHIVPDRSMSLVIQIAALVCFWMPWLPWSASRLLQIVPHQSEFARGSREPTACNGVLSHGSNRVQVIQSEYKSIQMNRTDSKRLQGNQSGSTWGQLSASEFQ